MASLFKLYAIKKYDLSSSVPYLSFVPLFMIISVFTIFGELPSFLALTGVVVMAAGAFAVIVFSQSVFVKPNHSCPPDSAFALFMDGVV